MCQTLLRENIFIIMPYVGHMGKKVFLHVLKRNLLAPSAGPKQLLQGGHIVWQKFHISITGSDKSSLSTLQKLFILSQSATEANIHILNHYIYKNCFRNSGYLTYNEIPLSHGQHPNTPGVYFKEESGRRAFSVCYNGLSETSLQFERYNFIIAAWKSRNAISS